MKHLNLLKSIDGIRSLTYNLQTMMEDLQTVCGVKCSKYKQF